MNSMLNYMAQKEQCLIKKNKIKSKTRSYLSFKMRITCTQR
jgi:hypothetical protein